MSLLGDVSYGFGNYDVVWYEFMFGLVANITGYVLLKLVVWSECLLLVPWLAELCNSQ